VLPHRVFLTDFAVTTPPHARRDQSSSNIASFHRPIFARRILATSLA
jgi:hypothetical protein